MTVHNLHIKRLVTFQLKLNSTLLLNNSINLQVKSHPIMTSILKAVGSVVTSKFLDKPKFEKTQDPSNSGIEERHYEAAKWVSTKVMGMKHEEARSTGFNKLFKYITGANENSQNVDMTAPVATRIVPGDGPNCENTFTVSFYIPTEHQEKPPKPTNPDVFIEDRPAMHVYVKSFGGFAKEQDWLSEAQILTESIKDKDKINPGFWFSAGYNSPFQLVGRTNEVWLVKKES